MRFAAESEADRGPELASDADDVADDEQRGRLEALRELRPTSCERAPLTDWPSACVPRETTAAGVSATCRAAIRPRGDAVQVAEAHEDDERARRPRKVREVEVVAVGGVAARRASPAPRRRGG